MESKTVKDLMLPLGEYALVQEDATLREALQSLAAAQTRLRPGQARHRAVLVTDRAGKIVGKLGLLGFLKALEPKYSVLGDIERLAGMGVSEEFVNTVMDNFRFWQDAMPVICQRATTIKIGQVMKPVAEHIDESKSLTEAIHLMVMWQTLSLLVTRAEKVIGILRLSDLFAEVARVITSSECPED